MLPRRNRPSLLTVVVVTAVLLSGCSALSGPLNEDAERAIIDDVSERFQEIDGFTATRELRTTLDGSETTVRTRVWTRPATGQSRTEILQPERRAGDVTVVGNGTIWSYDESERTVTRTNVSTDLGSQQLSARQLDELVDRFDVVYVGETELDGRSTHKLRLRPNETSASLGTGTNVTMWVDAEKRFPAKVRYDFGNVSATIRYENVTINPGIDDDRFTFAVPDDATVKTLDSSTPESYQHRSALESATNQSVPDPAVPDGFAFEQGTILDGQQEAISLQYANDTYRITVVHTGTAGQPEADGETITVDGRTATYRSFGDTGTVRLSCGDRALVVSGDVGRETLVDVAGSIDCS